MIEAKRNSCHVLKKWEIKKSPAGKFRWDHLNSLQSTIQEDEGLCAAPKRGIFDDEIRPATENASDNEPYERYLLDKWFEKTSAKTSVKTAHDQKKGDSLLMFLHDQQKDDSPLMFLRSSLSVGGGIP